MPPADGLELEFFVYDRLPETTEHRPDCVIFALASGRAEKMRDFRTYKTPVFDRDENIIGTAGVAQDITLLNRYHKKILDMAHKDELTGLSNRRFFYKNVCVVYLRCKVNKQIASECQDKLIFSVMFAFKHKPP